MHEVYGRLTTAAHRLRCGALPSRKRLIVIAVTALMIPCGNSGTTYAQDTLVSEPEAARQRVPVPVPAATRQVLGEVKDIFRDEYAAATTPQARIALSKRLVGEADKTSAPTERWVLLSEAMRLAAEAGDAETCFAAIDRATAQFAVDAASLKVEALSKLVAKAPPPALDGLAKTALSLAQKAIDAGDSQAATKSLAVASGVAKRTKNRALMAEITKIQQSARDQEKESKELAAITARLSESPGDPDVCLDAGKYLCFKAGDWDRGLPLLAKGSDTELARLAVAELNAESTTEAVVSLADAWWDWSDRERGPSKAAALGHAADLYGSVLAKTEGLDRARLEKRIKQAQSDAPVRGRRIALADLKEESVTGIQYAFAKDGTFQGKPFTCCGKQWPKGLTVMTNGQSSVVYKLPPNAKRLVGLAGVFGPHTAGPMQHPEKPLTFEILLDGHSVWKSDPLARRDETAEFAIELFGASQLELRTYCASASSAWSAWLNPEVIH